MHITQLYAIDSFGLRIGKKTASRHTSDNA